MSIARAIQRAAWPLALFCLASCNLSGGGTDVGNPDIAARVTGSIKHPDGSVAPFVRVHLRPKTFLSDADTSADPDSLATRNTASQDPGIQDGSTDTQGFFSFDSVPKGDYRIMANDTGAQGAVISLSTDGRTGNLSISTLTVNDNGRISGNVRYLGTATRLKFIVSVYGVDRWTAAISNGDFTLSDLPPGVYTLHIASVGAPQPLTVIVPGVLVSPGEKMALDTVDIGP